MDTVVISSDSHVVEAPDTYVGFIDPKWRDKAPRVENRGPLGDVFVIDQVAMPVPLGLVAAAGKPDTEVRVGGVRFEELHRSGHDSSFRRADQLVDGVDAEILYPTIGLVLCNHPDFDYKKSCFDAYNRWVSAYCQADPDRLFAYGQTAVRSPEEAVEDLKMIRELGLVGVMMPGRPAVEDYDSPVYDAFWRTCVELGLPVSFHILTGKNSAEQRGCRLAGFLSMIRACQDILSMMVLGGVFERHPGLKVVCAEADAGWVPHYVKRMDYVFRRHRNWLPAGQSLSRLPSEYFLENIYLTFQDDIVAFETLKLMNWRRLLWASDFPHTDSTWPRSREMLEQQTARLTDEQRRAILGGNAAELYGIDLEALRNEDSDAAALGRAGGVLCGATGPGEGA